MILNASRNILKLDSYKSNLITVSSLNLYCFFFFFYTYPLYFILIIINILENNTERFFLY
jgi:hypothetical protein